MIAFLGNLGLASRAPKLARLNLLSWWGTPDEKTVVMTMNRNDSGSLRWSLGAALLTSMALNGCHRRLHEDHAGPETPSATSNARDTPAMSPSTMPAASASGGPGVPGSASGAPVATGSASPGPAEPSADSARLKTYWGQVGAGRAATVKHNYASAIAAFDRALAVLPDDSRAYAERGYAQLLAKNYGLARDDFDRAAERTTDPNLLAQIWFNYGLTAEQEGRPKDAQSAFARSNEYNPTAEARAKLGDGPVCTARVTKTKEPEQGTRPLGSPTPGNFLSAFAVLAEGREPELKPTSIDQARSLLCPLGNCALAVNEGTPLRLKIGDTTIYGGVVNTADPELSVTPKLLVSKAGPCGVKETVSTRHQHPLHFRVASSYLTEQFKREDGVSCTEGSASCRRECVEGNRVVRDYLFQVTGKTVVLTVEQWASSNSKPAWDVSVEGTSARILGSGCDIHWDLQ